MARINTPIQTNSDTPLLYKPHAENVGTVIFCDDGIFPICSGWVWLQTKPTHDGLTNLHGELPDHHDAIGVVLAQLGLKAVALAWPCKALACRIFRPGQSHD
jgi:hypothetical protein